MMLALLVAALKTMLVEGRLWREAVETPEVF
jgi:hypothetical protein